MRKADAEARLRIGRRVEVQPDEGADWDGEVPGTVIVKAEPPSTWWVLIDPESPYRDKFGSWVMARMDDMGNLRAYEPKAAKGK